MGVANKFLWTPTLAFILFLLYLAGCAALVPREEVRPPAPYVIQEREVTDRLIDDGDPASLETSVARSLAFLKRPPLPESALRGSGYLDSLSPRGKVAQALVLFQELQRSAQDPMDFERQLRKHFTFWQVKTPQNPLPVLLTGYYEPLLEGSLEPAPEYPYPIYRRPDDLVELPPEPNSTTARRGEKKIARIQDGQVLPYYSREEIDGRGVLGGKGYELLWLKDPWERYVLHIQGSGQIRLPDGRIQRVGFAASNGRPYRSIGRALADRGFLPENELSVPRVRQFFQEYPQLREEIFSLNERYIFFRPLPENDGPIGALGFPVTPGRSVAVDFSVFPRGALAYLISEQPFLDPNGKALGKKKLRRFVLIQDTGSAMRGPERVDLFMGSGEEAGSIAGLMKEEGEIFLLLPR